MLPLAQIRRPAPGRVIMRREQKIVPHAELGRAVQPLQHRQRAFSQRAVGIHRTRSRPPVLNERRPQGGEIGQILDDRIKVSIAIEVIRTAPVVEGPVFQFHRARALAASNPARARARCASFSVSSRTCATSAKPSNCILRPSQAQWSVRARRSWRNQRTVARRLCPGGRRHCWCSLNHPGAAESRRWSDRSGR